MSRVLALLIEMRAITSPACTCAPGSNEMIDFDRQRIARVAAARQLDDLAVLALDDERRLEARRARRRAPVDDDALGDAGRLVDLLGHRGAFGQVLEADHAVDLGEDRTGERIPFGEALAALDLVALVDLEARAVLHAMHHALGARCDRRMTIATLRAIAIRSPFELRARLRLRIFTSPSKFDSMND